MRRLAQQPREKGTDDMRPEEGEAGGGTVHNSEKERERRKEG